MKHCTVIVKFKINKNIEHIGHQSQCNVCFVSVIRQNYVHILQKNIDWNMDYLFKEKKLELSPVPYCLMREDGSSRPKVFPVNFVKFLRTLFFIEHLWWLLLRRRGH